MPYIVDFPYCCSAEVLVAVGNPTTVAQVDAINKEYAHQRKSRGFRPTLVTMIITRTNPEIMEALHASDWEDYVTWQSVHDNYPCTLFGKVLKEYKEPVIEKVRKKAKQMFDF